ncbi:TlpA family protein disulfide reductase [bacterium]|nr:TlpA family protein disulfide reductase [bacterium]
MTHRRLAGLALLLAALLVFTGTSVSVGADKKAPEFTLPNLDGDDVTLSELLEDGPVIVDFWATWCKPCIKAFPNLQGIFDKYKNCGLTVLAISIDGPKSMSRVGSLIKSKGNTFEVLLDPGQKVARKFHVTSIPRTVLVNTDGTIAYAVTGYRPKNHEELEAAVATLLPGDCPEEEVSEEKAVE